MMRAAIILATICVATVAAQQLSNCDPIDPSRCMLPFPNNFWLRLNTTSGKKTLSFSKTFPATGGGQYIDETKGGWNSLDGFSAFMPIMTSFGNVNLDNLPHNWNVSRSLDPDCPSILLDTQTGKLVPHWVELDISAGTAPSVDKMLIMWPAHRLEDSRRYIVAYRNVRNQTGPVPSSFAFTALRDNINTSNPDIELRRAIYADMFSRLHDVGVARDSSLNLVWDFTTGSRESITNRMVFIRDDAFKRIGDQPKYIVTHVQDNVNDNIARQVQGVYFVPSYMTNHLPGSHFVLDSNGMPVYQDMFTATFTILIPKMLPGNGTIGSILQYGHGLFGSQSEVQSGYLGQQANQHGYVLAATDWTGLATLDAVAIAAMMGTDFTEFRMVPDRCQQGMLNALVLMKLMKSAGFQKDPAMNFNGKPVLDQTSPSYYYGNSQGGILGTMYMAVTTDVKRGVVGVTGAPYSLMLPRSHDFANLFVVIRTRYPNTLDRFCMFALMQLLWDRGEPAGYLHAITSNPLPNTPTHEILIHHALGDAQVSYQGAYSLGRSIGAVMFESNVHEPGETLFGFPFVSDTATARTAVQVTWQFAGTPPAPQTDIPPSKDTDTHEKPRRTQASQDQMYRFFTTGDIINYCGGGCH